MNKPLVSAVIASYNHQDFIEEAIISILNQTYENIQLIVIDDCSTDSTYEIIESLGREHNFIYEQRTVNKGHCTFNFNYATEKYAKGKYLATCASDDFWEPEKIQYQVERMESNPELALCYTQATICNTKGQKITVTGSGLNDFKSIALCHHSIPASSFFHRMTTFIELGKYDEETMIEDWEYLLRCAERYPLGFINKPLSNYRIHSTNMSADLHMCSRERRKVLGRKWSTHSLYEKAIERSYYSEYLFLLRQCNPEAFTLWKKSGISVFKIESGIAILRFATYCLICKSPFLKQLCKRMKKLLESI